MKKFDYRKITYNTSLKKITKLRLLLRLLRSKNEWKQKSKK